ncbi:MAG: 6-bladed beta-propeller [Tannerella sp.]|nr:6-bladed beta-propeller [Tannerella sp.]
MKKTLFTLVSFLICRCGFVFAQDLQKNKKVADMVTVGSGKITVAKWSLFKDTVTLPLSFFTKELEIIKLDDKDEALILTESSVTIGDKYILMGGVNHQKVNFKLFDKTGKYLTDVGVFGQGPGEYGNISDFMQK